MSNLIAILNVISWAGVWAFGYIALTLDTNISGQMVTAAALAALGGSLGMWAYLQLVRHSEESGYVRRPDRVAMTHLEDNANGESV